MWIDLPPHAAAWAWALAARPLLEVPAQQVHACVCGGVWVGAGEQGESLKECCGMRDGASNRTRAPKHAAAYEKQSMAS